MALKDWKKIKSKKLGNDVSIIYKKGSVTLELFSDSLWYTSKNMNVIIRDSKIPSYENSIGTAIQVKHCGSREEAMDFAKQYMSTH